MAYLTGSIDHDPMNEISGNRLNLILGVASCGIVIAELWLLKNKYRKA